MYRLTIEFNDIKDLQLYVELASKIEEAKIKEIVKKDRKNHGLDYDKTEE